MASFRKALLICAALASSIIAPARAGPSSDPLIAAANAAIPTVPAIPAVAVPELLDPQGEPQLADPADSNAEQLEGIIQPEAPLEPAEPATPEPVVKRGGSLAETVAQLRSSDPGSRELECLAVGIYFESKSEPLAGQLAVGQVIANRATSGRFPSSYCGVLFQRSQFSFIRGRSWPAVARSSRQWHNAVAIARIVDRKLHESSVGKALFFHARYVSPRWRLKRVAAVGNHIFYR